MAWNRLALLSSSSSAIAASASALGRADPRDHERAGRDTADEGEKAEAGRHIAAVARRSAARADVRGMVGGDAGGE